MNDDARVGADFPIELIVPGIDRIDASRAALQQAIGKPARRCAHIDADPARGVDLEMIERAFEFQPAAPDVFFGRLDLDWNVVRH